MQVQCRHSYVHCNPNSFFTLICVKPNAWPFKKIRQCTCGTYIFFYILQPSYSMYVFMQIIITYDAPTWKHFQLRNRLRIFWAKLVQNDQTHQMTPCEKKFNLNIGWLWFYLSEAHIKKCQEISLFVLIGKLWGVIQTIFFLSLHIYEIQYLQLFRVVHFSHTFAHHNGKQFIS